MSNVVKLPTRVDKMVLGRLCAALKIAWLSRHIDTNAFNIGLNILARMQEAQQYTINLTMDELASEVVRVGSRVNGGCFMGNFSDFIAMMQQLHSEIWIHSDIRVAELDREDVHERHFSCSPTLHAWVDFTPSTPVWFRFDPDHMDALSENIDAIHDGFVEATRDKTRTLEI